MGLAASLRGWPQQKFRATKKRHGGAFDRAVAADSAVGSGSAHVTHSTGALRGPPVAMGTPVILAQKPGKGRGQLPAGHQPDILPALRRHPKKQKKSPDCSERQMTGSQSNTASNPLLHKGFYKKSHRWYRQRYRHQSPPPSPSHAINRHELRPDIVQSPLRAHPEKRQPTTNSSRALMPGPTNELPASPAD